MEHKSMAANDTDENAQGLRVKNMNKGSYKQYQKRICTLDTN